MRQRVGVVGAHECSDREATLSYEVGMRLAQAGVVVVTGGLGGVMLHASRGAWEVGGLTLGILPGSDPDSANRYVAIPVPTGVGEMRNGLVVRASQALVAVGGGWGTLSEIALGRRMGKPIIGLASPYPPGLDYPRASTADDAVRWVLGQLSETAAP